MKRVVVYRLGSLGDTVVALPCLHKIRESFPDSEVVVLTNFPVNAKAAPLEAILGGSGLAQRYVAYPLETRSFGALLALRRDLNSLGADTLVYLTPARGLRAAWRDLAFFALCGFKRIIGTPLTKDLQRHRRGADGELEMECERLVRCLAPLGAIDLDDAGAWSLHLSAAEHEEAAAHTREIARQPRIAINMGGKFVQNDWGEANWSVLVTRLRAICPDHALMFVGAAEDIARADRVKSLWKGAALNLCGKVSPRVSAAAMRGSTMFLGHDSGPLHLAACMGVSCVGLYGDNHEPRKWHPYGEHHRIIHDMRGVLAIGVDQVLDAVRAALEAAPSGTVESFAVARSAT